MGTLSSKCTTPGAIETERRVDASPAQRRKVAGLGCLVCGRRPSDPAHLVPQRLGGCSRPECVVPLCRTHHRLFDSARLRLGPYIGREQGGEIQHALTHVSQSELTRALGGHGWPAPWATQPKEMSDEHQQRNGRDQ